MRRILSLAPCGRGKAPSDNEAQGEGLFLPPPHLAADRHPLPRGERGGGVGRHFAWALFAVFVALALTLAACGSSDDGSAKRTVAVTKELQPATTYYWKVMDVYSGGGVMVSETRRFTTPAQ